MIRRKPNDHSKLVEILPFDHISVHSIDACRLDHDYVTKMVLDTLEHYVATPEGTLSEDIEMLRNYAVNILDSKDWTPAKEQLIRTLCYFSVRFMVCTDQDIRSIDDISKTIKALKDVEQILI